MGIDPQNIRLKAHADILEKLMPRIDFAARERMDIHLGQMIH